MNDQKKKILIVDDEQDVLTFMTAIFQDHGYETITAMDGKEGFDIARARMPDLITLDIAMPNQSGVRTYRMYKEDPQLKDIPVIIVTGVGDSMRIFLNKLGGFSKPEGFVNKPIVPEDLIRMTGDLLSSK